MNAIEKVMMNVGNLFWTTRDNMVEELKSRDYIVTAINYEYVEVYDAMDKNEAKYVLYLEYGNNTMWVERVGT